MPVGTRLFAFLLLALAACSAPPDAGRVQASKPNAPADTAQPACSMCAEWNRPHAPLRVYGNTHFVGTDGLSVVLVTSPEGHVLIDGALPESAPLIRANVEALGFRMADVRLILNSHEHFDHAGGLGALQQASGATVVARAPAALVLEAGRSGPDDPQDGELLAFPAVETVRRVADGETVRVGPLALTAHATPGHTAGGTTWTWTSCEGGRCLNLVYADSLTPVSADGFRFRDAPTILADFERTFATVERLPCDVLVTPHPSASRLWDRVAARDAGDADALVDPAACTRYAATARQRLADRLASEG